MAISLKPTPILLLLLTFTRIFLSVISSSSAAAIFSDLRYLQSQSPSGVIHLNENLLHRIFNDDDRSFYLVIFFDARQLHEKPDSNLKSVRSEFDLISKSFLINNQNSSSLSKLFFCDIELTESKNDFRRFGINALPNIRIVPPDANDPKSDSIPLNFGDFSGLVESMVEFIESNTGLTIGELHRPPFLSKTQVWFLIGGFLVWLPFMIKRLIAGDTILHNKKIWIFGTMFVYFFSVSGSMFILIRKLPFIALDRKDPNKVRLFYRGSGMQFGAEGMYVGFLFTIVGLLLSFVTRIVVRIKDSMIQRAIMISALVVSFWAVREVVGLDHWKTGYFVHAYLPSSWYT